eukprot:2907439-Prymnesium_polylepis.1
MSDFPGIRQKVDGPGMMLSYNTHKDAASIDERVEGVAQAPTTPINDAGAETEELEERTGDECPPGTEEQAAPGWCAAQRRKRERSEAAPSSPVLSPEPSPVLSPALSPVIMKNQFEYNISELG